MKKSIIGVDGNEANVANKVGVSVYTFNLLKYFQSQSSLETQFVVYLRSKPNADLPSETENFRYKVVWGPKLWSQLFLPLHLWVYKLLGGHLSVFFSPAHYIPRFCPFKTVVTIHDLSYLYFPNEFLKKDLYQLKNWTEYALNTAEKIIAVSKTTKKDLIHEYSLHDEKISVIYNGYEVSNTHSLDKTIKINDPYFLYVGTVQPRKNLNILITAFAEFQKAHPQFKLIIAGKKGWLYENIFKHVEELELQSSIIFPGFVSEEEKNNLYKHATAFILPSLYEGFGIPLLEAMAHECPVISSFSSSLPEVGGEACLYFDPKNSEDLVEKMNHIISNKELSKQLISFGKKRIELFSWLETGKNTLQVLQTIQE
jgi:glycosyltransferase involved in cell wall biosynthesis